MLPEAVGRYRVTGVLGTGGFGTVFAAHDPDLDVDVAVKVLSDHLAGDPAVSARFLDEARILRRLDHPRVVGVHDLGTLPSGQPWFVMDLMAGGSLDDRLRAVEQAGGAPTPADALVVATGLAEALQVVHGAGLVHADVKPANLFIAGPAETPATPPGGQPGRAAGLLEPGEAVVLGDFGLAGVAADATGGGGTPGYHAPEQADPSAPLDARTDLYAATALVRRLLTGDARPGRGERVAPASVTAWLDAGQAEDPDARPPDARSWLAELDHAVRQAHTDSAGVGRRRRRLVVGLGALVVAAVVGAVALLAGGDGGAGTGTDDRSVADDPWWPIDPEGVAVATDGGVVVADTGAGRLLLVSGGADVTELATGLDTPGGVAVLADGRVVVTVASDGADGADGADGGGSVPEDVVALGPLAGVPGDSAPCAVVEAPDGGVLVADAAAHRVLRVDIGGNGAPEVIAGTGQRGFSGDGGPAREAAFSAPCGVAALADGTIVVADTGNHRVRTIAPDGTVRTIAGDGTADADGLSSPRGLAVDSDGLVWVADPGNARVVAVDPAAGDAAAVRFVALAPGAEPVGVALDGTSLLVVDRWHNQVVRIDARDAEGDDERRLDVVLGGGPEGAGGDGRVPSAVRFDDVTAVAVGAEGQALVVDGSRVREVTASVVVARTDLTPAAVLAGPAGGAVRSEGETVLAVDADGTERVVVTLPAVVTAVERTGTFAAAGDDVYRIDPDGTATSVVTLDARVGALAVAGSGELWAGVGDRIVRVDLDGATPSASVVASLDGDVRALDVGSDRVAAATAHQVVLLEGGAEGPYTVVVEAGHG